MSLSVNLDVAAVQTQNPEHKPGKYFTFDTTRSFYNELFSGDCTVASVAAKIFFVALPFIAFIEGLFGLATAPFTFMNDMLSPEKVAQIKSPRAMPGSVPDLFETKNLF